MSKNSPDSGSEASAESAKSGKSDKLQPSKKPSIQHNIEQETSEALELVMLRNNFYRDHYRQLMLVCLGLLLLTFCLIFWALYERTHKPPSQYFATTYDGKLIPLIPLSQPSLTDNALLQWATEAAVASYTFNYVNYRKALQDARIYFTATGYQYFLKALQDSNNLIAVQNKKLIVSAAPTGAPVILKKGLYNDGSTTGVFTWDIQLPLEIVFRSAVDTITQNVVLNMRIVRVPTLESPSGVGIATYVISEGKQK